jgi:hypothetical protein
MVETTDERYWRAASGLTRSIGASWGGAAAN